MDSRFQYNAYRYFLLWGIFSSLVLTLSCFVDATLVGRLTGSDGLAAYNLITPVFLLYALLGVTIGVGANVRVVKLIGEDKKEEADEVFHSALTLGLIVSTLLLFPLLFKRKYASFLGLTGSLYPLSVGYLSTALLASPAFVMYHILSASVRSDGNPRLCFWSSLVVCLTNITLDIVFMKVMKMGIKGAAIALCIGETLGVFTLLSHFFRKRGLLTLSLKLPHFTFIRTLFLNGCSVGSAYIFSALVMLFFNTMLLSYGGTNGALYVAIYGIIYTMNTTVAAVYDGNGMAMQSVISFLTGEADSEGIIAVLKRAIITMIVLSVVMVILFSSFSSCLIALFGITGNDDVYASSRALRIFLISAIFTSLNTTLTSFWLSIGRTRLASLMSLIRNCLLILLFGFILVPGYLVDGLGLTYIASEASSLLIALIVLWKSPSREYMKKKFGTIESSFEKTYLIKKESMGDISSDIERISRDWDIDYKRSFMINFILEEILLNIIKFALSENSKKEYYISIKIIAKDEDLCLRIRDNVKEYNPFDCGGDEIDSGVLKLIKKKTKYLEYQRKMIFNYFYTII